MRLLVTGTAGFIGNALTPKRLERGDEAMGVGMVNADYDDGLKRFLPILEGCRHHRVEHLACASTRSMYGASTIRGGRPIALFNHNRHRG